MQMMYVIARFIISVFPIDHLQIPDDLIIKLNIFIGVVSLMVGKMVPLSYKSNEIDNTFVWNLAICYIH